MFTEAFDIPLRFLSFSLLSPLCLSVRPPVWLSPFQESNAEKALEALKELQPLQARVLRSGMWKVLPSADLVPGDVVDVRCGDKIPADCRLISLKSTTLRVEQSQLTGESVTVSKVRRIALCVHMLLLAGPREGRRRSRLDPTPLYRGSTQ